MAVNETIRVGKVLKDFNIGLGTLVDFLKSKKIEIESSPSTKITPEAYELVAKEFGKEQILKEQSKKVAIKVKEITERAVVDKEDDSEEERVVEEVIIKSTIVEPPTIKIVGNIDIDKLNRHSRNKSIDTTTTKIDKEAEAKEAAMKDKSPTEAPASLVSNEKEVAAEKIEVAPASTGQTKTEPIITEPTITEPIITEPTITEPTITESTITNQANKAASESSIEQTTNTKEAIEEHPKKAEEEISSVKEEKSSQSSQNQKKEVVQEVEKEEQTPDNTQPVIEHIETKVEKLAGPKISGTIDLSQFEKKKSDSKPQREKGARGKRERIRKPAKERVDINKESKENKESKDNQPRVGSDRASNKNKKREVKGAPKDRFKPVRNEVDEDAVQKQIRETYLKMVEGKGKTRGARYRRDKRELASQKMQEEQEMEQISSSVLKVTEFVTVNDLAIMMDVQVTKVIEACMNLGLMVSINQRLDAEAMVLVAEEFGFKVEFVTADIQDSIQEEEDSEEDLERRPPIVTVMGHVDHGKTSLLDYVRKANVIAGEAGGITQHIGAYNVKLSSGQRITFLDTPGHEAFTAMRARGAKITDIAIIIIAADDAVMPQTKEAINHAQAAGVPMIFAINKVDKPSANPEKIREQLAALNLLVEDWGGKYQSQEISAKKGLNMDKLLEKVLLEAELLDLKANPDRRARGSIIESSLDKGRGFVATVLVQNGTLRTGDIMLCGSHTGRVKAMFNERGQRIDEAGPSSPVSILGLNGAPAAGELFNVMEDEKEARDIANKREQLIRIQGLKTQKHITLEEIGRRIAIGNFQELNIIVKGDVDGSIEALSDSLIKLSTEEVHVNVIHKAVGAISESDVLLAAASNAIIIGFQVRPSVNSRRLAEKEEIEIRLYSVIYDAINEVKSGIEGMLAPEEKEEVTATAEVREVFKISKIGTIAGCMVKEGKLTRNAKVRVIRDGIVVYTGSLGSLKRFKDDVKEVSSGYDCGLNIDGYNDIKVGDVVEAYTIVEIKRKL